MRFELFADEAWTHGGNPPFRYHCFYGGVCGPSQQIAKLDTALRTIIKASGSHTEVKWSNLTQRTSPLFREIVECLVRHLGSKSYEITYRQMFCDRAFVRVGEPGEPTPSDLDVQFKLCYQFIKSAFGLKHLPQSAGVTHEVLVRLDTHSSQKHKDRLEQFVSRLGTTLSRPDVAFRVTFVNSARTPCIQACDLLMGAAGSYGNRMHDRRPPNGRGMSPAQKLRFEFAKFVYAKLRQLDSQERGSRAFNWFETTGHDNDPTNRLLHKVRIWKFQPKRFRIDKGWQNDHLDRHGMFVRSDVQPEIRSPGSNDDFTY